MNTEIMQSHGDSGRAIHLVTVYILTGAPIITFPRGNYVQQVVLQSRGIMDDFGSLVFVEQWR